MGQITAPRRKSRSSPASFYTIIEAPLIPLKTRNQLNEATGFTDSLAHLQQQYARAGEFAT
jgi:hypothetical protein